MRVDLVIPVIRIVPVVRRVSSVTPHLAPKRLFVTIVQNRSILTRGGVRRPVPLDSLVSSFDLGASSDETPNFEDRHDRNLHLGFNHRDATVGWGPSG